MDKIKKMPMLPFVSDGAKQEAIMLQWHKRISACRTFKQLKAVSEEQAIDTARDIAKDKFGIELLDANGEMATIKTRHELQRQLVVAALAKAKATDVRLELLLSLRNAIDTHGTSLQGILMHHEMRAALTRLHSELEKVMHNAGLKGEKMSLYLRSVAERLRELLQLTSQRMGSGGGGNNETWRDKAHELLGRLRSDMVELAKEAKRMATEAGEQAGVSQEVAAAKHKAAAFLEQASHLLHVLTDAASGLSMAAIKKRLLQIKVRLVDLRPNGPMSLTSQLRAQRADVSSL